MRKRDRKGRFIDAGGVTAACLHCGNAMRVFPYQLKCGEGKYCNRACQAAAFKGRHFSPQTEAKPGDTGARSPAWKGDSVGYDGLHRWIGEQLGKPNFCEHCKTTTARNYQWANKSHEYKRDLSDWIRLCVPCHKRYDLDFLKNGVPTWA